MAMIAASLRIFIGSLAPLPGSARLTGMLKSAAAGPLEIGSEGFVGDQQADRRVHGGPEKAVHLYPAEHYAALAAHFPEIADHLVRGCLGENLSTTGLTEADVCIGDVFALGGARLQVCQPRSPCWKIDSRLGMDGVAAHIAEAGLAGWYFRVLVPGRLDGSDRLALVERAPQALTLAEAMAVWSSHRPAVEDLERIAGTPGIAAGWRRKFLERAEWLRQHTGSPAAAPSFHAKPAD